MVIGLLAAPLAWLEVRASLRPAVGASPRVGAPVVLQASGGGGAAAKAAEMLGKMGIAAIADAKPGEVPVTKEFISSAKIRHVRTISAVAGGTVGATVATAAVAVAAAAAAANIRSLLHRVAELILETLNPIFRVLV